MRVLLIGCGPTGLGFLYAYGTETTKDVDVKAIEKNEDVGGLSSTLHGGEYVWEYGPHIFHSHYSTFDSFINHSDGLVRKNRESLVSFLDSYIPYPFQSNIHMLPDCILKDEMLRDFRGKEEIEEPRNMEEWAISKMGKSVYDKFYRPLNLKSWSIDPQFLGTMWVKDRVNVPSLELLKEKKVQQSNWGPNSKFFVSSYGGVGRVWKDFAKSFNISFNTTFENMQIMKDGRKLVKFNDETSEIFDVIVSTSPLDELISKIDKIPDYIINLSHQLKYNGLFIVCIGIYGEPPSKLKNICWIYYPEEKYPWYRMTVYSNYSPQNAPCGRWSVIFEFSSLQEPSEETKGENIKKCREYLKGKYNAEKIDRIDSYYSPRNYPIPLINRDKILNRIHLFLEMYGIYSRGRFGGWKYEVGNMDHSFMQGYELYMKLTIGTDEVTYYHPDKVNS